MTDDLNSSPTRSSDSESGTPTTDSNALYEKWAQDCLDCSKPLSAIPECLTSAQSAAKDHFEHLIDHGGEAKDTIAKELAKLIAKLGPALSLKSSMESKMHVRASALSYLLGAIKTLDTVPDQNAKNMPHALPFQVMELVSHFLLEHCGPTMLTSSQIMNGSDFSSREKDNGDLNDLPSDDVRDCAIACITALLKIQADINCDGDSDVGITLDQCIKFRIRVAQKAIQKRSASLEDCDDDDDFEDFEDAAMDDDYKDDGQLPDEVETKILSNISRLPRAKRSLCFRTIESAVISMKRDSDAATDVCTSCCADLVINFASFGAACLYGETDPRCLIQMLHLLKLFQTNIAPIVEKSEGKKAFQYSDIFDSVAVYYPVRFTPPPNDPHGISRESINSALMEVLICSSRFESDIDTSSRDNDNANMTVLAAGLFLERMSPPRKISEYDDDDDQEVSTVQDRIEALQDLKSLLLVPFGDASSNIFEQEKEQQNTISKLTPKIVKEMSDVLYRCHEEAAASASTLKNDDEVRQNKTLADGCRHFVTRIAYDFEQQHLSCDGSSKNSLWSVFVKDTVHNLVLIISTSPQSLKGRLAIAYLASLSACGGEQTLRLCVDTCIPQLSSLLDEYLQTSDSNRDDEKVSTVVYGMSVMFSSCRLSMDQITKDGLNIYPHPLALYGSRIIQTLRTIINDKMNADTENLDDDLTLASIKALESILLSSPRTIFKSSSGDVTNAVREIVLSLAKKLVANISSDTEEDAKWKLACAQIIGSTIGNAIKGINESHTETDKTLLQSDPEIMSFVEKTLFPTIISSSVTSTSSTKPKRYDWVVLGFACKADQEHTVLAVVSQLYMSLVDRLKNSTNDDDFLKVETVAGALSYVMENGGPSVYKAFHSMPPEDQIENDLVHILTTNQTDQSENGVERISVLMLPGTREGYRSEAYTAVKLSLSILPHILPAFGEEVPRKKIEELILRASQVLPPLSDWDGAELCTIIPILSVALSRDITLSDKVLEILIDIAPDLIDYVLNRQVAKASRSAAASCLFSIVVKYQTNDNECLGLKLINSHVSPVILSCISEESQEEFEERMKSLEDAINVAALVASAACQRGKASAQTTDMVTRFFALVSCESAACAPGLGIISPLDCTGDASGNNRGEIPTMFASALGSILSITTANPFVKQRLAHIIVPIILSCRRTPTDSLNSNELGCLMCASHILCCVNVKALGQKKLTDLTSVVTGGLEKVTQILCGDEQISFNFQKLLQDLLLMLLTSFLKLSCQCPSMVIPHLGTIMPTLLLITIVFNTVSAVALNLMSLQMLVHFTNSSDDGVVHFCKAYKATVVKHLAKSLDHPSYQVRQAAVQARNVWSVIE